jgi:hypothetical protein
MEDELAKLINRLLEALMPRFQSLAPTKGKPPWSSKMAPICGVFGGGAEGAWAITCSDAQSVKVFLAQVERPISLMLTGMKIVYMIGYSSTPLSIRAGSIQVSTSFRSRYRRAISPTEGRLSTAACEYGATVLSCSGQDKQ